MNVQFVSNDKGEITAVQIPIEEWREISRRINVAGESEWQGVSAGEIAAIEAGIKDFEEARVVPNEAVLSRSRELRKNRA